MTAKLAPTTKRTTTSRSRGTLSSKARAASYSLPLAAPGLIAGVDEAGRGPLAGPVVAAAVVLDPNRRIRGIRDSKELDAEQRETLAARIRASALAWSVAWADVEEIDSLNILQATFLAMRRALLGLHVCPAHVLIDGNLCPSFAGLRLDCTFEAIVDGDALKASIGAASILAKTQRDAMMAQMDALYPGYGFASHKGYSTPQHYKALERLGPTPIHRHSFEPVRLALEARRMPRRFQLIVDPQAVAAEVCDELGFAAFG